MCVEVCSLWHVFFLRDGRGGGGCEVGTVLKDVCWGLGSVSSSQVLILWATKREQLCRMCVEFAFSGQVWFLKAA